MLKRFEDERRRISHLRWRKRRYRALEAVAVCVRFHHGEGLRVARMPARNVEIVPQGTQVNGGEGRAIHGKSMMNAK